LQAGPADGARLPLLAGLLTAGRAALAVLALGTEAPAENNGEKWTFKTGSINILFMSYLSCIIEKNKFYEIYSHSLKKQHNSIEGQAKNKKQKKL